MSRFTEALKKGLVFTDGATGTMLQKRGLKVGSNPTLMCFEHPDVIEEIHEAYFKAGSNIVCSNTFSACALKLEGTGVTVDEAINAAIGCAKRAAAPYNGMVALDIGPLGELIEPLGTLSFERAVELFAEQMSAKDFPQ